MVLGYMQTMNNPILGPTLTLSFGEAFVFVSGVRLEKSAIVTLRGSQNQSARTCASLTLRDKDVMLLRPSFFNIPWHRFCS